MNISIVSVPDDKDELARRVLRGLRPHWVPDSGKFVADLQGKTAGKEFSGEKFADQVMGSFKDCVNTGGAGVEEYTVPLLKKVVNEFVDEGTTANQDAHRRLDELAE